eukprot:comp18009_c0_seq1/m.18459 comp18009_c0_seq1/g.18459  ORF comp18009_c0_seq1/g.18459 comp18009_c0_seq1/m.18459 type:complete len:241 (-) comp18009_c0_seq1:279-1001(-)
MGYIIPVHELTAKDTRVLRESWAKISSETPNNSLKSEFWVRFFDLFYEELFHRAPDAKHLFNPKTAMHLQAECLVCLVSHLVVRSEELRSGASREELRKLGKLHAHVLSSDMYIVAAQTLYAVISTFVKEQNMHFTPALRTAWAAAIATLVEYMNPKIKRAALVPTLLLQTESCPSPPLSPVSSGSFFGFVARAKSLFHRSNSNKSARNRSWESMPVKPGAMHEFSKSRSLTNLHRRNTV